MKPFPGLTPALVVGILLTLLFGAAGGWVFNWLRMPLAWMIGAMVVTTVAALAGAPLKGPGRLRHVMMGVLGIMLGSAFTPDAMANVGHWIGSIAVLIVFIVVVVSIVAQLLARIGGFDAVTAYFSASPGGLATMVLLGAEMGGDERSIALVHAIRIMLTVLIIPFWFRFFQGYEPGGTAALGAITGLAGRDTLILVLCALGYPMARLLRFPAAPLIGPMLFSAAVHLSGLTAAKPPAEIVNVAQVVIGTGVGCRFVGVRVAEVLRTMLTSIGTTLLMLGLAVVFALGISEATGLEFLALWLAFAPGGLAEMTLISLAMGIDTAFVSTHHLVRVLFMVIAAPIVFRLLRHRLAPAPGMPAAAAQGRKRAAEMGLNPRDD
ncbi:MAG: AbrB family transcriptional regulator [Rhodospirillales bacterium]